MSSSHVGSSWWSLPCLLLLCVWAACLRVFMSWLCVRSAALSSVSTPRFGATGVVLLLRLLSLVCSQVGADGVAFLLHLRLSLVRSLPCQSVMRGDTPWCQSMMRGLL